MCDHSDPHFRVYDPSPSSSGSGPAGRPARPGIVARVCTGAVLGAWLIVPLLVWLFH